MIKWTRTSKLSIKNSLSLLERRVAGGHCSDWSYTGCWSKRVCMIPHQVDAVSDRVVLAVNGLMRARTVWRVGEQCTSECPSSENVNKFRRALTVWLVGFPRRRSSSSMHGRSSCISDLRRARWYITEMHVREKCERRQYARGKGGGDGGGTPCQAGRPTSATCAERNLIQRSVCHKCSNSMKITTQLDHISTCRTSLVRNGRINGPTEYFS